MPKRLPRGRCAVLNFLSVQKGLQREEGEREEERRENGALELSRLDPSERAASPPSQAGFPMHFFAALADSRRGERKGAVIPSIHFFGSPKGELERRRRREWGRGECKKGRTFCRRQIEGSDEICGR